MSSVQHSLEILEYFAALTHFAASLSDASVRIHIGENIMINRKVLQRKFLNSMISFFQLGNQCPYFFPMSLELYFFLEKSYLRDI